MSIEYKGRGGVLTIEERGVPGPARCHRRGRQPGRRRSPYHRATWHVITPSTGAANLSCGVDASGGTFTDIISGLAVNGSIAGKVYNGHAMQNTTKTEIEAPAIWTAAKKLGFTGSASTAGLVGRLYVEYIRINSE